MNVEVQARVRLRAWIVLLAVTLVALNVTLPRILRLNGGPSIQAAICIGLLVATVGLQAMYFSFGTDKIAFRVASFLVMVAMLTWSINQVFFVHERLLFTLSFAAQWVMVTAAGFGLRKLGFNIRRVGDEAMVCADSALQYSLLRLATFVTICSVILAVVTQVNWEGLLPRGPDTMWTEMAVASAVGGSFALVSFPALPATIARRGIAIYLPLAFAVAGGVAAGFVQLSRPDARIEMVFIFFLPAVVVVLVSTALRRLSYRLMRVQAEIPLVGAAARNRCTACTNRDHF